MMSTLICITHPANTTLSSLHSLNIIVVQQLDSAFLSLKVCNFPLCFVSISLASEAGLIGISVSSTGDGLRVDSLGFQYQFSSSGSPCIQAEHSASHQEICSLNSTERRAHANFSTPKGQHILIFLHQGGKLAVECAAPESQN